jgi:hypothetical protein
MSISSGSSTIRVHRDNGAANGGGGDSNPRTERTRLTVFEFASRLRKLPHPSPASHRKPCMWHWYTLRSPCRPPDIRRQLGPKPAPRSPAEKHPGSFRMDPRLSVGVLFCLSSRSLRAFMQPWARSRQGRRAEWSEESPDSGEDNVVLSHDRGSWEASIRPWQGRGHRMPPPPGLWEPPSHFLTTSLPDTVDVGSAE